MTPIKRSFRVLALSLAALLGASLVLVACGNEPDDNTVAKYLPSNTAGFVTVALNPSTKQKANLLRMSKRLPSDVEADKAEEVRDKLLKELFSEDDLNFETEIKPWLGNEAAMAVLPPLDGSHVPVVVGAVQAKSEKEAVDTLTKHKVNKDTYRYLKGYMFFVEESQLKDHQAGKALDAIEDVVNEKAKSLQSDKRFSSNIDALHGEHVVLGWFDTPVLVREGIAAVREEQKKYKEDRDEFVFGQFDSTNDYTFDSDLDSDLPGREVEDEINNFQNSAALGLFGSLFGLADNTEDVDAALNKVQQTADEMGSYSFEVWLTGDGVNFQAVTEHARKDLGATTDRAILNGLPSSTMVAVDVADFGKQVSTIFEKLTTGKDAPLAKTDKEVPEIRKLIKALGNEAVFVVDNSDPVGVGFVSDLSNESNAKSALSDLMDLVGDDYGVSVTQSSVGNATLYKLSETGSSDSAFIAVGNSRLVIASSEQYTKALLQKDGTLGNTGEVKRAFGDEDHLTFGALYINLHTLVEYSKKESTEKMDAKEEAWLNSLDVLGVQNWEDKGHEYVEVRLGLR